MRYQVTVKGLDRLQASFAHAPETTKNEVSTAINKSLVRYQGTAKKLSPIDTGRLRGSISIKPAAMRSNVIRGSVFTSVGYAIFQELGTRRGVPARYFMKGSLEENQPHTDRYFQQAADNITRAIAEGRRV